MRQAFLLSFLILAQPAHAADWLNNFEARHSSDWAGSYAGVFGGLGISSGKAKLHDYSGALLPSDVAYGLFPHSIKDTSVGGLVGVAAGVNFQTGAFVGGVEADIGYVWTKVDNAFSRLDDTYTIAPFDINTDTRYKTDFGLLGTVRAKGGYAFGDTLIFATAGLAAGDVSNRFELALPEIGYTSPNWSASGLRLGYVAGLGIEHRMTSAVSIKFETLYVNLADRVVQGTDPAAFPGESISYRFTNDMLMPRLGMSIKF